MILPLALVHRLERGAFDYVDVELGSVTVNVRSMLERTIKIERRILILILARCFDMACYLGAMRLGAVDYREKLLTVQDTGRGEETLVGWRSTPP